MAITIADVSYWLFTIFNILRIVSYLPQIYRVATDSYGASAIAYSTWGLWAVANASTALYAAYNVVDLPLAAINLLNASCCLAVILLTIYKRKTFRLNQTSTSEIKNASAAEISRAMESSNSRRPPTALSPPLVLKRPVDASHEEGLAGRHRATTDPQRR
jgi:hypothetical protein